MATVNVKPGFFFKTVACALILIPKAGIKIADVPVTFAYVLLVVATVAYALGAGLKFRLNPQSVEFPISFEKLLTIAALAPFVIYFSACLIVVGTSDVGYALSLVTGFFILPSIVLGVLGQRIETLEVRDLYPIIRWCVLLVALLGIAMFFYYLRTGDLFQVPYLTINADDASGYLNSKMNLRGDMMKLMSTYQNGQIYGVSMLLLLPLFEAAGAGFIARSVVKLSLILTLSRTAWIGLACYQLLKPFFAERIRLTTALTASVGMVVLGVAVYWAAQSVGPEGAVSFLLDPNLGGRADMLDYLRTIETVPTQPIGPIREIVYLSILHELGFVGLVLFVLAMFTPAALAFNRAMRRNSSAVVRASSLAMLTYLIACASDGALEYIPVLAFWWFMVALSMNRSLSSPRLLNVPSALHRYRPITVPDASLNSSR
jgi:hypothetical protein